MKCEMHKLLENESLNSDNNIYRAMYLLMQGETEHPWTKYSCHTEFYRRPKPTETPIIFSFKELNKKFSVQSANMSLWESRIGCGKFFLGL